MSHLEFKDKNGNTVNALSGRVYDHLNYFSIDMATNHGYDTSHTNQDRLYVTIDNAINGSVATFRTYNLPINEVLTGDNSSGTIIVKKQVPNIIDVITGIAEENVENLQSITNSSINTNIISHPFTSTDPVIAKLYVTIAGQKYSAICPQFSYKSTLPTLSNFSIKQNADSSKLEVTNLNVQNITSIKYYPEKVFILADVLQKNGDLNTDYEFELGRAVVNADNQYIASSSSMTPLDNNNNSISDNNVIPLTQNKYEISTSSDASAGILYKQNNKDIIVYSISETKSNVILDYSSQSLSPLYLRAPVSISNVNPFDAILNAGSSDSSSMPLMNVVIGLDWSVGYEPTSFVFKLTTINNNISHNAVWTFSTSTVTPILYRADGIYNISLGQMVYVGSSDASDTATHLLDNNPSSYRLNVTARWEAINESRSTTYPTPVVFTQDFPTVLNVTAYNAWEPLSTFNPENIDSDDTVMPRSAFILKVLKNNLFNGNAPSSLDDPSKTQFQIQYIRSSNLDSNGDGNWINVPSGYITQPSETLTGNNLLYNGALSALTGYKISPNSKAGGLFNVPELAGYNIGKVGSQQHPLFVYLANIDGIYNESAGNPLLFRVKILSSVDGYDTPSSQFVSINNPIYAINKPLIYSFTPGNILEPYMDFSNTPNKLAIPMLVGTNDVTNNQSIYYSNGYVEWIRNSALDLSKPIYFAYGANPQFNVNLGTLVTYRVVYNYINPNISGGYLRSKQSIDYSVYCQGLPAVSSDFTVSNDSTYYVYDNAPEADSLRFSLSMVNDSTSDTPNTNRIDGVSLFIRDHQNYVLNNGNPISIFYNYNASGIVKYTPGSQTVSLSSLNLTRGNSYKLEFKAFRDPLTESKGGVVYSSTIADHYNPPPFIYLNTNVRDTPVLYNWGVDDIYAQPYIDFATDNVTAGMLVIPMDISQSPNYYGAYVNWYKNDYLRVNNVASDAIPVSSALQSNTANLPQFPVTYGTVVIYTVTYIYLSLDGTTQISGTESSRRSLSAQGMPAIDDFTQSPAVNAGVAQYIQDNNVLLPSLVFKLNTVNTSNPVLLSHRIDGVILFIKEKDSNNDTKQFVTIFPNALIELLGGDCVVENFTGSPYSLRPGNTYSLIFQAYRDARVLTSDVFFENGLPSNYLAISETVTSTVDFVFLASPIAPIFDDQTAAPNVISVKDTISHSSSGPPDQYTIIWPLSKIDDVTDYLVYRVTEATESVPESSILETTVPANSFPSPDVYEHKYDIPPTSQKIIYDIQKSYKGRLSESTRISFYTGLLKPASITVIKQDFNHILVELADASIDIATEHKLLDIMVSSSNGSYFPFLSNDGKKNPNGKLNTLIIKDLEEYGQQLILQQEYKILWDLSVNGNITQSTLDTSYGPPAPFVYASRPSVSLYYSDINANMVVLQGKPALKLRLNASMGLGLGSLITPTLTNLVVVLSQDTSTVVQNVKVDGVENLLMFSHADDLQPNSVYNAASDYSNSSLNLILSDYSNNVNTTFQLHTGNLTLDDASHLVFPTIDNGYISNTGVDFMIIASNNYGIDSHVNSFVFVNSPTFTQNGVTVTGSFTIQNSSEIIRVGEYFRPNYPISNSSGVISYSSSNSLVATVDASSGLIGALSAGSTTITMTQAAATSGNYASGSVSAILVVLPPLIEPSLSNFTVATKNMGDAAFSLTAPTSNSNGSFSYTSSNTDVATIASGITWTTRTSAADNAWLSVAYGNGLWVAVAETGTGNRVMTSPDGINWTSRTSAADNAWRSVAYGNGLWVAVAATGSGNRVMTSPDGINWTSRTSAADNEWRSVAYGNGLWVAVAATGSENRVMTSPDGINWTIRTSAAKNGWSSVAYGNGLWVAVSYSGSGNRVMTSPDGINWTIRTSAANNQWYSVAYGNGLWVAVAISGTGNRVMTSPDGITWTSRTSAADNDWLSVAYGNGLWVAVAINGANRVMTSPDGITWTSRTISGLSAYNTWYSVAYGNGLWVAVAINGSGDRVMTSSANSINIIGAGSSIITATQAATTNYSSGMISATFTVNPPPDYSIQYFERRDGDLTLISEGIYRGSYGFLAAGLNSVYVHNITYNRVLDPSTVYVVGSYIANGGFNQVNLEPLIIGEYYQLRVKAALRSTGVEVPNFEQIINFQV
jgi:hypothetical protein